VILHLIPYISAKKKKNFGGFSNLFAPTRMGKADRN